MSMTERHFSKLVSYNTQLSFSADQICALLSTLEDSVGNDIISTKLAINFAQNLIKSDSDDPTCIEDELVMGWIDDMHTNHSN